MVRAPNPSENRKRLAMARQCCDDCYESNSKWVSLRHTPVVSGYTPDSRFRRRVSRFGFGVGFGFGLVVQLALLAAGKHGPPDDQDEYESRGEGFKQNQTHEKWTPVAGRALDRSNAGRLFRRPARARRADASLHRRHPAARPRAADRLAGAS